MIKRVLFSSGVFVFGSLTGFLLWNQLRLPFSNPFEVIGPYALEGFNPSNEILSFLIFLSLPCILLLAIVLFFQSFRNELKQLPKPNTTYANPVPGWMRWLIPLFAAVFALNSGIVLHEFDYFHDGESLGPAISMLNGQVPFKDYLVLHGWFQDPGRAVLAFKLFGQSISSLKILDAILKIITFVFLFELVYQLFKERKGSFLAVLALLVFLGIPNRIWTKALYDILPVLNLQSRDICTFIFLLSVLALWKKLERSENLYVGSVGLGTLAGFIPVISFLYSADRAYYLSFASFLIFIIILLSGRTEGKRRMISLSWLTGVLAGWLIVIAVLSRGFPDFFKWYFAWLPVYKELVDGIPYDPFNLPFGFGLILISGSVFSLFYRFVAIQIKEKASSFSKLQSFIEHYFIEILLTLVAVIFFRSALGRSDYYHLAYISIMIYLALFAIAFHKSQWSGFIEKYEKKIPGISNGIFCLVLALGIARLGLGNAYLIRANFPVGIPDEVFLTPEYLETAAYIKENLAPNEAFFTLTNELSWYYLIERPCPSRHQLINFASPLFMQKELLRDLKAANLKFILYNNEEPFNHFDWVGFRERVPLVTEYVESHFEVHKKIGLQELWIRKQE